jgi:hypothetical protein
LGRLTKQAKTTRFLLSLTTEALAKTGFEEVSTLQLLSAASEMAMRSVSLRPPELLLDILKELQTRDLTEAGSSKLLDIAKTLLCKGGEVATDQELTMKELEENKTPSFDRPKSSAAKQIKSLIKRC